MGTSFTKGLFETTFIQGDKEVTTHWNTRAEFHKDMQSGEESLKQRSYLDKVSAASYDQILGDPEMMAFSRSMAKGIFGDNCAACHGSGGAGVTGQYPNLVDDDWLWGGTVEQIEDTLTNGRQGYMPGFKTVFSDQQLDDVSEYVLGLSGHSVDPEKADRGGKLFKGQGGGCHYCHTQEGTGLASQGAANLTDQIWTLVDVQGAEDLEAKKALVKQVIRDGAQREMPAWAARLSPEQIKLLTVYVHELGGGQ